MKGINQIASHLGGLSSGASLGGKVVHYRDKRNIYKQGMHAYTPFYSTFRKIQEGGVRLTTRSKHQPSAVTAILGVGDFFGELSSQAIPFACPPSSR
jgi:CRP-like cAMP-binding protein